MSCRSAAGMDASAHVRRGSSSEGAIRASRLGCQYDHRLRTPGAFSVCKWPSRSQRSKPSRGLEVRGRKVLGEANPGRPDSVADSAGGASNLERLPFPARRRRRGRRSCRVARPRHVSTAVGGRTLLRWVLDAAKGHGRYRRTWSPQRDVTNTSRSSVRFARQGRGGRGQPMRP